MLSVTLAVLYQIWLHLNNQSRHISTFTFKDSPLFCNKKDIQFKPLIAFNSKAGSFISPEL